jgi:hypothetical protein
MWRGRRGVKFWGNPGAVAAACGLAKTARPFTTPACGSDIIGRAASAPCDGAARSAGLEAQARPVASSRATQRNQAPAPFFEAGSPFRHRFWKD